MVVISPTHPPETRMYTSPCVDRLRRTFRSTPRCMLCLVLKTVTSLTRRAGSSKTTRQTNPSTQCLACVGHYIVGNTVVHRSPVSAEVPRSTLYVLKTYFYVVTLRSRLPHFKFDAFFSRQTRFGAVNDSITKRFCQLQYPSRFAVAKGGGPSLISTLMPAPPGPQLFSSGVERRTQQQSMCELSVHPPLIMMVRPPSLSRICIDMEGTPVLRTTRRSRAGRTLAR